MAKRPRAYSSKGRDDGLSIAPAHFGAGLKPAPLGTGMLNPTGRTKRPTSGAVRAPMPSDFIRPRNTASTPAFDYDSFKPLGDYKPVRPVPFGGGYTPAPLGTGMVPPASRSAGTRRGNVGRSLGQSSYPKRNNARGSVMDSYVPNGRTAEEDGPLGFMFEGKMPSLEDFLLQAEALFQGEGNGIANRQAALEANRRAATGTISSATAALADALTKSRGEVDARYTQGIQGSDQATSEAQAAIQQAHAASLAQQQELARNLGGQVDQSRNTEDTAWGVGSVGELGGARGGQMRTNQLSAYELGSRNRDAAQMRGVENLGAYERDFQGQLAALLDEQQALKGQAKQQALSMYGNAQSQYNNDRDFAYREWLRQNEWAREDAQNQIAMEQEQANSGTDVELTPYQQLMQELQGIGVTPGKADQWGRRLYQGIPEIQASTRSIGELFGKASPAAQAALQQYLINSGIIGKG